MNFKEIVEKKAQGSLEYLMTYSWALVAILVVLGAIAYFGLFNLGGSVESCTGFPAKIVYAGHQYKADGSFGLAFTSILSHKIQVKTLKDIASGTVKTFSPVIEFFAGTEGSIAGNFSTGTQGDTYSKDFLVTYDEFGDDGVTVAYANKNFQIKCNGKFE